MRPVPTRAAAAALLACALALAACSDGSSGRDESAPTSATAPVPPTTPAPVPGDTWERTDPAAAGFDAAKLDALATRAEQAGSSCLVVTRGGRLVSEWYWRGATPETEREAFSVTKSVTSILIGIADDSGALSLDDPAARYIPRWSETPAEAVTVEHLLSNDSGRHWDPATDYAQMALREPDKTAFAIALPQDHAPGEVWAYNNSAIQTLDAVLEAATGQDPAEYARERLLEPIGMRHSRLTHDAAGNTLTFMGLRTTCRDLARFGLLVARGGEWAGEQVVSRAYVEAATAAPSTPLNAAYGYLFWLNRAGRIASPLVATTGEADDSPTEGQLVPDAPDDTVWALGFRNQIVAIVPSLDLVAVRLGDAPPAGTGFDQATLTLGVLDALTDRTDR